ncbi:hypothetical protein P9112_002979 [Eukaryota sp. TZLM1-RC]
MIIPQEIHPSRCNDIAPVFTTFLDRLCKGKYAINILWEFFGSVCAPFEHTFLENSVALTNNAPRKVSSEKLSKIFEDKCFDNKWSSALSTLNAEVKALNGQDTVEKLEILHPFENPLTNQNYNGEFWKAIL